LATDFEIYAKPISFIDLTPQDRIGLLQTTFLNLNQSEINYGLGQAIIDFTWWEINTGRLDQKTGSSWWKYVNGTLAVDAYVAYHSLKLLPNVLSNFDLYKRLDAIRQWQDFFKCVSKRPLTSLAQKALWRAHQSSITTSIRYARYYFHKETVLEQEFIKIVLFLLSEAEKSNLSTETHYLRGLTQIYYPKNYPATQKDIDSLVDYINHHQVGIKQ